MFEPNEKMGEKIQIFKHLNISAIYNSIQKILLKTNTYFKEKRLIIINCIFTYLVHQLPKDLPKIKRKELKTQK